MKKIAICPQCKTKVTVEGELNQRIPIECKNCGKKGVIVFRKPTPPNTPQKPIKTTPPSSPPPEKPIPRLKKPKPLSSKTPKEKKPPLFKKPQIPIKTKVKEAKKTTTPIQPKKEPKLIKTKIKTKIRELKQKRDQAIEAHNHAQLKVIRKNIKSLKNVLRKATV